MLEFIDKIRSSKIDISARTHDKSHHDPTCISERISHVWKKKRQCHVQEVPIPEWFGPKPTVPFARVGRFSAEIKY